MRETDEEHHRSAYDIAEYLEDEFGIFSDRRSIYKDIKEINKTLFLRENSDEYTSLEEADELFKEARGNGELEDLQTIVYDNTNMKNI